MEKTDIRKIRACIYGTQWNPHDLMHSILINNRINEPSTPPVIKCKNDENELY